jgi:CRP/FNR family cyclic AMP-dependent transcriptional regulator
VEERGVGAATVGPAASRLSRYDEALVRGAQLFRGVEIADVDAIVPSFTVRELRRRQELFVQGETEPLEIYVILEGRLQVTRRTRSGQARASLVGPGETIGELSVFDPGPRSSTGTALTALRAAVLERETYLVWAVNRPYVAERLLRVLARRLRRSEDAQLDLLFVDVGARTAKVLLDLAERFGQPHPHGIRVDHGLKQEELAQLVGSSRETVNKMLREFSDRGWIEQVRGSVVLRQPERLRARTRTSR